MSSPRCANSIESVSTSPHAVLPVATTRKTHFLIVQICDRARKVQQGAAHSLLLYSCSNVGCVLANVSVEGRCLPFAPPSRTCDNVRSHTVPILPRPTALGKEPCLVQP